MLRFSSLMAAIAIAFLGLLGGCSSEESEPAPTPSAVTTKPKRSKTATQSLSASPSPQKDTFDDASDAAASAATITQSAKSKYDWDLVASKWEEAIVLMKAVPSSSKNYALAQRKAAEYQKSLVFAAKKAGRAPNVSSPKPSATGGTQPNTTPSPTAVNKPKTTPQASPKATPQPTKSP